MVWGSNFLGMDFLYPDYGGKVRIGWWHDFELEEMVGLSIASTSVSTSSSVPQNYGAVKLSVSDGHCAIGIENGVIKGLRPQLRMPFINTDLTRYDHTILCNNPPTGMNLTLPATPCIGQEYEIYKLNPEGTVRIYANGHTIFYALGTNKVSSTATFYSVKSIYSMVKLIFMGHWELFEMKNVNV